MLSVCHIQPQGESRSENEFPSQTRIACRANHYSVWWLVLVTIINSEVPGSKAYELP